MTAESIMLMIAHAYQPMQIIAPWLTWNFRYGDFLCAPVISGIKKNMYDKIAITLFSAISLAASLGY